MVSNLGILAILATFVPFSTSVCPVLQEPWWCPRPDCRTASWKYKYRAQIYSKVSSPRASGHEGSPSLFFGQNQALHAQLNDGIQSRTWPLLTRLSQKNFFQECASQRNSSQLTSWSEEKKYNSEFGWGHTMAAEHGKHVPLRLGYKAKGEATRTLEPKADISLFTWT